MECINRFSNIGITSGGAVSPLGLKLCDALRELREGRGGIRPLTAFELADEWAGEAPAFDLRSRLKNPKSEKLMSRSTRLAMFAAAEAMDGGAAALEALDRERIAVEVGSGHTGLDYDEFFPAFELAWNRREFADRDYSLLGGRPARLVDAYFSLKTLSNAGVGLLAAEHDLRGPSNNYVQNDGASAWALAGAATDLESGRADAALAGGHDSLLNKNAWLSYLDGGLLARSPRMTPFGRDRSGVVLGEGAAFFLVEPTTRAVEQGRRPLAHCEAFLSAAAAPGDGWIVDGLPALEPHLRQAFESGLRPDYVVARGIATPASDCCEAAILARLGVDARRVTAWKGWTGYLGAATAAVELALTIHGVRAGFLPSPLANGEADPALPSQGWSRQPLTVDEEQPLILFLSGCFSGQAAAWWFRIPRLARATG